MPDFFVLTNFREVGKFAASIERPETKSASAPGPSGGPCLPVPFAPGPHTHWELCHQTLVIGSRYCARHGAMPPLISRYCRLELTLGTSAQSGYTVPLS